MDGLEGSFPHSLLGTGKLWNKPSHLGEMEDQANPPNHQTTWGKWKGHPWNKRTSANSTIFVWVPSQKAKSSAKGAGSSFVHSFKHLKFVVVTFPCMRTGWNCTPWSSLVTLVAWTPLFMSGPAGRSDLARLGPSHDNLTKDQLGTWDFLELSSGCCSAGE